MSAALPSLPAEEPQIPLTPLPVLPVVEKPAEGPRVRMIIGSGGVDACARLMEPGKPDKPLFSTGEVLKAGLGLDIDAYRDGGMKRDAVSKSNSARTRLRNVDGAYKFRTLGLTSANEVERPVACAYLSSTILLELNVKPEICADAFTSATHVPKSVPVASKRPLEEFPAEVIKEHLVRNPHLMTQALQDPRCHGARTVVVQSQLAKARPQLEHLTGVLGFVVPRDALDRMVMPAVREVGRVLGGVLIANVPRYATTYREDQQVAPPAAISASFTQRESERDLPEEGVAVPPAVRHRGPALSAGQKKEILKTIAEHPDRLPTSRSLVRERDRVELQNQTGMPVEDLSRHRKIARRDGEGYLRGVAHPQGGPPPPPLPLGGGPNVGQVPVVQARDLGPLVGVQGPMEGMHGQGQMGGVQGSMSGVSAQLEV